MKGNLLVGVVTGLLLLGMGRVTNATLLLDFEEFSSTTISNEYQTQGYTMKNPTGSLDVQILPSWYQQGDFSGNGTTRVMAFNDSRVSLSRDDGGRFDLVSFLGGGGWIAAGGTSAIWVMGYTGGSVVSQFFALDLSEDPFKGMQKFSLGSTFKGVSQVEFFSGGGSSYGFSLDDIRVKPSSSNRKGMLFSQSREGMSSSPVPEPATLLLLGTGVTGLIGVRRKKKA